MESQKSGILGEENHEPWKEYLVLSRGLSLYPDLFFLLKINVLLPFIEPLLVANFAKCFTCIYFPPKVGS